MSRRSEIVLRSALLVLAVVLLVVRLLQQDWIWAGLWAGGALLVAAELRRVLREDPRRG